MQIEPNIFYISVLVLASLVLLIVGLVALYLILLNKYMRLKSGKDEESGNRPGLQATEQAQSIIAEAEKKAAEIIKSTQTTAKDAQVSIDNQRNVLNQELEELKNNYANLYKEALKSAQDEAIKLLQSIPEDVRGSVETQISGIRTTIQDRVDKAADDAKKQVEDAYQKAEAEVENYKRQRLKQVDESIIVILQEVSRKVLSREITREEHEKLVMKALEEAKRQHVFSPEGDAQVQAPDEEENEQKEEKAKNSNTDASQEDNNKTGKDAAEDNSPEDSKGD